MSVLGHDFLSFFDAYVECALWSSTDESDDAGGEPLDKNYSASDLSVDCLARSLEDCLAFWREYESLIGGKPAQAGHDFWLTRNRHGAGYWDGDWPPEDGRILTDAAHVYGSVDLYVGDDGMIYS